MHGGLATVVDPECAIDECDFDRCLTSGKHKIGQGVCNSGRSFSWDSITVRGAAYDELIKVTNVFLTNAAVGPAMTMAAGFSMIAYTAFLVKGFALSPGAGAGAAAGPGSSLGITFFGGELIRFSTPMSSHSCSVCGFVYHGAASQKNKQKIARKKVKHHPRCIRPARLIRCGSRPGGRKSKTRRGRENKVCRRVVAKLDSPGSNKVGIRGIKARTGCARMLMRNVALSGARAASTEMKGENKGNKKGIGSVTGRAMYVGGSARRTTTRGSVVHSARRPVKQEDPGPHRVTQSRPVRERGRKVPDGPYEQEWERKALDDSRERGARHPTTRIGRSGRAGRSTTRESVVQGTRQLLKKAPGGRLGDTRVHP
ncbi:hypothetical protein C8J57DRAFT_1667110 [Mycena rebaudengoi]|nr:hypothetical protein C8J57DRAFT_1667110 [Mycena rebaudengoi]